MRRLLAVFYASMAFNLSAATDSSRPYCEETSSNYLNPIETPLGFSGQDLLRSAQSQDIKITYHYKPGSTNGHLYVVPSVGGRYITSTAVYPPCTDEGGCPDIGILCKDRVEIDAIIILSSDDGAFSETFNTTLVSPSADGFYLNDGTYADVEAKINSADLVGNFYDDSNQPPHWQFSGRFTSEGFSGEMFSWILDCGSETCSYSRTSGVTFSPIKQDG